MGTAYVYDPIYLEHDLPSHPENARRLRRILSVLNQEEIIPLLTSLEPRPATVAELQRVHTATHIEHVQRIAESGGGYLDPDTYTSPRSFDAAVMAAGGLVRAVEAVLENEVANGFALVRPPGHHATPTRAMGFCLFNNVAVAAQAALADPNVERVFIVDFDVHHGNGTQDIFADDPAIFYSSTHQYPHYPGTGRWNETGTGRGKGTVLNVPLPSQVGDAGYAQVFAELVWPLAERFKPDLIRLARARTSSYGQPVMQRADCLDA